MDNATSKYVLGVARAPGSDQFPITDQSATRISSEWPSGNRSINDRKRVSQDIVEFGKHWSLSALA